jgi:urease accessory protein
MRELIAKMPGDGATAPSGGPTDDTVTLPYALRQKSRQRVTLDGGAAAAFVLPPGTHVDDGDRLRTADGFTVRVCAARETVSTARTADPLRLARACYHLGNRHVALQVGDGWVRYLPDHVLDDMVRGLGLAVAEESARFEPERGAYAGQAHGHAHHEPGEGAHGHHGHDHPPHDHEEGHRRR